MMSAQHLHTVAQITVILRDAIASEPALQDCWVEGEISNIARPSSGHIYLTLKDERSQIRCAIFRSAAARLNFSPKNGDAVLLHGRLSIYDARSEYQIIGDWMEPSGIGVLQLAFERLKKVLAAEGLFDEIHKKSLPEFPQKVGVVTSPTGAAFRDILRMLQERYPAVEVLLVPTLVQGEGAADQIANAIACANRISEMDLLIVGRGGGSIEDLWAFNEEVVARAIFSSHIPIVSAIGHETDFTIADFVADFRAPTPSAAVELAFPDQEELLRQVANLRLRLKQGITTRLRAGQSMLSNARSRIVPGRYLDAINRFHQTIARLDVQGQRGIEKRLANERGQLKSSAKPLTQFVSHRITAGMEEWRTLSARLTVLNPMATIARGYGVCQNQKGETVREALQVQDGEMVDFQLSRGRLKCKVVERSIGKAIST